MIEAALWGLFTASSLLIGGLVAMAFRPPTWLVGLIMAFGAGALISAVAYELVAPAVLEHDTGGIVTFLLLGSLTFFAGDWCIERLGGGDRKAIRHVEEQGSSDEGQGGALGIVLGSVLDGIPESFVLGITLIGGGGPSAALVASIYLSNVPEGIGATAGLRKGGMASGRIIAMWVAIAVVSALAAMLGYAIVEGASGETGGRAEAFAAGAILTMLADTMMPEAFKFGGNLAGVATVLGFILAFGLTLAEM
jgi:ZIP family zinc transporter